MDEQKTATKPRRQRKISVAGSTVDEPKRAEALTAEQKELLGRSDNGRIAVDKVLFARMVKAIVQGPLGASAYRNRAGITRFGMIMGGQNNDDFEKLYRQCLKTVEEDNKRQLDQAQRQK